MLVCLGGVVARLYLVIIIMCLRGVLCLGVIVCLGVVICLRRLYGLHTVLYLCMVVCLDVVKRHRGESTMHLYSFIR